MVQSGKLIVPMVFWSSKPPHMSISSVAYGSEVSLIIFGTASGHIVLSHYEDANNAMKAEPFAVIECHSEAVNSITLYHDPSSNNWYFTSSSEDGDLVTWNLDTLTSVKHRKFNFVTTKVQAFPCSPSGAVRLFCIGQYQDLRLIDPVSLVIVHTLVSRISPDWVSAFTVFHLPAKKENVVVAITQSAVAKVWTFGDNVSTDTIAENESKPIRACHVVDLICCPQSRRTALVVCSKYWQVYDLSDFSTLCQQSVPVSDNASHGERWLGGVFINLSTVLVWSSAGAAYMYRLPSNSVAGSDHFHTIAPDQVANPELLYKYALSSQPQSHNQTCVSMFYSPTHRLLVAGSNLGILSAWRIHINDPAPSENGSHTAICGPMWSCSLADTWKECHSTSDVEEASGEPTTRQSWSWFGNNAAKVTVSVFIGESQKFVCGLDDGHIAICPAIELLQDCFLGGKQGPEHLQLLKGHVPTRVTALLYPFADDTRYDPDQLLSGGADFAVCVWSLRQSTLQHRFTVQAGEILRLLVTPPNCSVVRLLSCVCSVASDNSVALLNIKEHRCHLLASQHPYPVNLIRWRPSHDFMLVRLTNGDVYVWEMETGHLDRVVTSIRAEAVLMACDMDLAPGAVDVVSVNMQTRKKQRHIMHRRLRTGSHAAHPTMAQPTGARGAAAHQLAHQHPQSSFKLPTTPVHLQPLHLSLTGYAADALVAYIDIETLIINLASEKLLPPQPKSAAASQQARQTIMSSSPMHPAEAPHPVSCEPLRILGLAFSFLHAWGLVPDIDAQLLSRLGVVPPRSPMTCYGTVVSGQLFSLLPGWLHVLTKRTASSRARPPPSATTTMAPTNPFSAELTAAASTDNIETWKLRSYWATGGMLSACRLLPVVALANAAARLEQIAPQPPPRPPPPAGSTAPARPPPPGSSRRTPANGQDAQLWLQMCTMYTVLLPELIGPKYRAPPLQVLANRFHDHCIPVRDTAQSLLSAELSRVGAQGRKAIVEAWAPYLPQMGNAWTGLSNLVRPPQFLSSSESIDDLNELICPTNISSIRHVAPPPGQASSSGQAGPRMFDLLDLRRLQGTAVVLLSIIGTDFGQAVMPPAAAKDAITNQPASSENQPKQIAEGFSVADGLLAQATAYSLAYLVSVNTDQLSALAAVRRAAAALVGRGFAIWEPYLDISQVLLALFALCPAAASEQNSPWNVFFSTSEAHNLMVSFVPLSSATDASRTARHSLALIATARPKQFIVSTATEVRRFYASLASSPNLASLSSAPPPPSVLLGGGGSYGGASSDSSSQFASDPKSPAALLWARSDILRLLDSLVERYTSDVQELLLEAVDIAVFCLDPSALRGRQLIDFIPNLARMPSIAFCIHSQRIAVGGRTGLLVFYEPPKSVSAPGGPWARFASQAVNAHAGQPVTEVLFSPDGRHLASYSAGHRKVSFWQPASSSLFSSSSGQLMKLVKSIPSPAVPLERVQAAQRVLPRLLFWSDRSTLHLRLGTEQTDEFRFPI